MSYEDLYSYGKYDERRKITLWKTLKDERIKVNVDDSVTLDGHWGFGAVIRDYMNVWYHVQ